MAVSTRRDYAPLLRAARERAGALSSRQARMDLAVDLLWDAFGGRSLSWIGFYEKTPGKDEMILLARRDKPACSPLGLHGMCGRSWKARRALLLHDARALKDGYIACDPRDLSEAVVPLFDASGECWGVLDADSYEVGTFDQNDIDGMTALSEALGLTMGPRPTPTLRM